MRFDKNTGKTVAFACVILFAGILFSTWVLPVATEDRSEQAIVLPVTLNNPQKIIESPAIKADPQKMYPTTFSFRDPINSSQMDETVVQARNLFLKNVSENVEYLFNLKIDSVIMEKYAEVWELSPGKVSVPIEPVPPQEPDVSTSSDGAESGDAVSGETESEPADGNSQAAESQDSTLESEGSQEESSEPADYEKELELQRLWEEYERQLDEYRQQAQVYQRYRYEEGRGNAFSLDILFTDAKSTTWRVTACGYADEVFALHCVKEEIEVTPVSIFQENLLDVVAYPTIKMDSAVNLFRSRIESVEAANDIYKEGYFEYIELSMESPDSEYYWHIYGWAPNENLVLMAGFRADGNTPVCYCLVPLEDNISEVLQKYGYDMGYVNNTDGYGY